MAIAHESRLPETPSSSDHWQVHARQWRHIGSPLRPCLEDVAMFSKATHPGRSVLLGVTPELADISFSITAVDNNQAMLETVWPGNLPDRNAVRGDWLRLPFAADCQDNIVGDGCPVLLAYPDQHRQFFTEAARVLRLGGRMVVRVFVAPDKAESCSEVRKAALAGRIGSFHAFKWRLAMALIGESEKPVIEVREVSATFEDHFPDRQLLADCTGWPLADIATIDAYSSSDAIYSFPTLAQLRAIVPPMLSEVACEYGSYELADCCPVMTWERIE